MSFINPFLLIGVLAAGIPVLIHLWSKRQARLIDFSHVDFLMSLHRKRVKRLKLKQILILIIRMLIIVLIAMALARPILTNKWALAAGGRAKSSVIIILDNSYSMSYESFEDSRFDTAKNKALLLLESLQPGDNASLILMSDLPDVVFMQLTSDIQQVRDAVKDAQISHRGSNVRLSISEAYTLLKQSDHPHKVIYLISDLGKNGWQDWKEISDDPGMVDIFVIRIGEMKADNRSIEDIALSNEPVGIGMPIQISAKFAGTGFKTAGTSGIDATVELLVDGEKTGKRVANKGSVSFTQIFKHPGTHIGEIRLTSDRLSLDDVRYFVIDVLGQIKVLCAGKESFYVNLALNPVTSLNPEAEVSILPVDCTVEELKTLSLDQYDVVILADVVRLDEDIARRLENFALNGGNVVIFLGEAADHNWYNNQFELTSVTLGERVALYGRNANLSQPLRLSKWDVEHPIFKIFDGESVTDPLKSLQFYSVFSIKPKPETRVIASFDRDIPAILETEAGWGRVMLFNTSTDTKVSDLPLSPAFLPLIQQTIFYLVSEAQKNNKNILVGDKYIQHIRERIDSPPKLFDPEDNITTPAFSASEEGNQIQYSPVQRAGIYKLESKSEGRLRRDYFAVNLNTSGESDLIAIKDKEVIDKLGERAKIVSLDDSPEEIFSFTKSGSEFSSRLLIAAAILMLLEIPLANRRRIK